MINSERRVRVERLVTYCDELMSKAFSKNEQLLELAKKTNDPAPTSADLEKWLHETTVNNDEILKRAREYIDEQPQSKKLSQNSRKTTTVRTKCSKASSSKLSKTSSQRQRDLIIAQQRREEIESRRHHSLVQLQHHLYHQDRVRYCNQALHTSVFKRLRNY